jgi:hypothetical protein
MNGEPTTKGRSCAGERGPIEGAAGEGRFRRTAPLAVALFVSVGLVAWTANAAKKYRLDVEPDAVTETISTPDDNFVGENIVTRPEATKFGLPSGAVLERAIFIYNGSKVVVRCKWVGGTEYCEKVTIS